MESCKSKNQNSDSKYGSTNEKMVSILVVDDDRTCLSVVASLLKGCSYQVLTAKDPLDALCILQTGAIKIDLIVSDVHMPGLDGFELQRRIQQEFQIPVVCDREASKLCEGSESGASFFVIKPITAEDLKSIWDFRNQWKKKLDKGKNITSNDSYDNDNEDDIGNKLYEKKSKRKLQITDNNNHNDGENIAIEGEALVIKKKNLNWTQSLHGKFLRAMQYLGSEGSIPRKIVSIMNVPGLKREEVASHLQQKKRLEAEHDPDMFKTLQNGNRWSSSFLSHKALLGYGKSKLLTNPGFARTCLMNGTYPSEMYHMNHNGFSRQIQPPACYNGSGQEVHSTFVSQRDFAYPQINYVVTEQQNESTDDENKYQDYYVGNNFDFGDAFLEEQDMPNTDKVHTELDEYHDNRCNNTGTPNFETKGNRQSNDDQQGMGKDF
ncbi:two-component response regulator ARR14-like [Apium graveolens]|uniref:two-component response regulator ARR14-like n=1 Tax=Apium graveolens TaxID=4045 RepID=UPI003D7A836F